MPDLPDFLPDDCLSRLNDCLESIPLTAEIIERCKRVPGMDVSRYEEVNRAQAEQARALKAQFFPHSP